jgi:RimJ/RimL family protein N-acetyltransferase
MISIRHFSTDDANILQTNQYKNMAQSKLLNMINDWNTMKYNDRYFEMFAIEQTGEIVGSVSLYQHCSSVISAGPEIFSLYRRCGYAFQGVSLALAHAKDNGYSIAVAQVRKNNEASIALHKKLGFDLDHEYVNKHGNEVYFFIKAL